jgi:hypothetical protein
MKGLIPVTFKAGVFLYSYGPALPFSWPMARRSDETTFSDRDNPRQTHRRSEADRVSRQPHREARCKFSAFRVTPRSLRYRCNTTNCFAWVFAMVLSVLRRDTIIPFRYLQDGPHALLSSWHTPVRSGAKIADRFRAGIRPRFQSAKLRLFRLYVLCEP